MAKTQLPSRDCHVGRWPPRNDKSGAFAILTIACTNRKRCAGSGMPLPYTRSYGNQFRSPWFSSFRLGQFALLQRNTRLCTGGIGLLGNNIAVPVFQSTGILGIAAEKVLSLLRQRKISGS